MERSPVTLEDIQVYQVSGPRKIAVLSCCIVLGPLAILLLLVAAGAGSARCARHRRRRSLSIGPSR